MQCNVSLIRRIAYYSLLTMVCWSLLGLSAQAQSNAPELDQNGRWINGITEPWWFPDGIPKEDVNAAQLLWATIGNQGSGSAWAGTYVIGGDTHGSYLRWAPQSGFVLFHVNKCEASVMGFSYGKVVASMGLIEMMPEKAATATASKSHSHGTQSPRALRFLPIIWRQTRYLVPEDEITEFSDYISGLGRYNDRNFLFVEYAEFFSKSDEKISGSTESEVTKSQVAGDNDGFVEPLVPTGYKKFIKRPIDAKITSRGTSYVRHNSENEWWNDLIIPVTVNVGSGHGLKKEMVLRVVGSEGFSGDVEYVKITNVNLHSAKGIIERPVRKRPCIKFDSTDDCKNPDYEPLKVGSRVTTNPVTEDVDSIH
jgi:hypothetical protein